MFVKIDDLFINLDNATTIEMFDGKAEIKFTTGEYYLLTVEQTERLLRAMNVSHQIKVFVA